MLGTFSPLHWETKSCFHYKILSIHMKKREINILIYDTIYMWKTVQNHSAPLQYLNSFFLNKSSVQDLWPFHSVLEFISLNTVLKLKSFSYLVRRIIINIFVVLWHLILTYFIFSKWLLMTFIFYKSPFLGKVLFFRWALKVFWENI